VADQRREPQASADVVERLTGSPGSRGISSTSRLLRRYAPRHDEAGRALTAAAGDAIADRFVLFREPTWRERPRDEVRAAVEALLDALEAGAVRAAIPDDTSPSGWRAETWVKQGILAAFALGTDVDLPAPPFAFRDRDTLPPRAPAPAGTRVVPGGSAVRRGAHLGKGVVVMPPAYVNVGAFVDEGSMVDSHALVGSCAQIGRKVHLSAAAQVGGVLEPVGALPVVVEDEVFVGGGVGLYEGVVVKRRSASHAAYESRIRKAD